MFKTLASKDPDDSVAYQTDWRAFFAATDDTLDSVVISVVDAMGSPIASDLVIEAYQATASGVVTYWLSGGTAGLDYLLRVTVYGARILPIRADESETVVIPVRQK